MGRTLAIIILTAILGGCTPAPLSQYESCADSQVVLLPHHKLMENRIDAMLSAWPSAGIEKVIVLSPNHFLQGRLPVERPNDKEHGWTIFRDKLTELYPDAELEGKMVRVGAPENALEDLVTELKTELADPQTRLVVTVDFSHNLPGDIAELHDLRSQDVIRALDAKAALTLEVDSPELLYILTRLVQEKEEGLKIVDHTNPSLDSGIVTFENTTHVYACMVPNDGIVVRTLDLHMDFAQPREFYEGKTLEDRYLYGYDSMSFNQGGQDTATLTNTKTGELTETVLTHFTP